MINDYFFCVKGYRDLVQFLCSSMKNNLCLCTQNKNLMAYIITIDSNSNIAKNLIQYIKHLILLLLQTNLLRKPLPKQKLKQDLKKLLFPKRFWKLLKNSKWPQLKLQKLLKNIVWLLMIMHLAWYFLMKSMVIYHSVWEKNLAFNSPFRRRNDCQYLQEKT